MTENKSIIEVISRQAEAYSERQAVEGLEQSLSYGELVAQVGTTTNYLRELEGDVIGLLLENGPLWVVADLAAQAAGKVVVPLPLFFSDEQLKHVIEDAAVDLLLTDDSVRLNRIVGEQFDKILPFSNLRLAYDESILLCQRTLLTGCNVGLEGVGKITYTSGTTGAPKGVCLSSNAIFAVSEALKEKTGATMDDCHLCLTPLSTLLENIAGIYVPLLAGGKVVVLPSAEVGLKGASGLNIKQLFSALTRFQASSAILIPQMLLAMVTAIEMGLPKPDKLRFLAVGGAPVSTSLLARAAAAGLPLFQGYGLSECASVVSVNCPDENRVGSVGKPLPHLKVSFSEEGEIFVKGPLFKGYLGGEKIEQNQFYGTGDIGYQDDEGYLWVTGRKKSLFITSFGRNVAPEWLESEFSNHPAIQQIAIFGEARPWNCAVIVSQQLTAAGGLAEINRLIEKVNEGLPDYGQVKGWVPAKEPFSLGNGQWTGTARPRREVIYEAYKDELEQLYLTEETE